MWNIHVLRSDDITSVSELGATILIQWWGLSWWKRATTISFLVSLCLAKTWICTITAGICTL
jgi:hypothetical protein